MNFIRLSTISSKSLSEYVAPPVQYFQIEKQRYLFQVFADKGLKDTLIFLIEVHLELRR